MDGGNERKITRRKGACSNCRTRKVRCLRRRLNPLQKSNLICTYDTAKSDRLDKSRNASIPMASIRHGSRCYQPRKTKPASQACNGIQSHSPIDAQNDLTLDWFADLDAAQYVSALSFIPSNRRSRVRYLGLHHIRRPTKA
ncbi:MAG: hypothetical protein LQ337_003074 [Flavoplaca oasis]|nr:MAG: hypothetical protein LQ337_003074 [Flavoplaca oasis]